MHTSLFFLAVVVGLGVADINCDDPIATGALYWSPASSLSYSGQIGTLKTRENAEHLATCSNSNAIAHNIAVIPCNSTFLNASNPSSYSTTTNLYVKLQLADDSTNCLGLKTLGEGSTSLIMQTCDSTETDAQIYQFWLRDAGFGGLVPVGAPLEEATKPNVLKFNSGDTEKVIASPHSCGGGNGCQDKEHIVFVVDDSTEYLERRDNHRSCWGRGCAGPSQNDTTTGSG